MKENPNGPSNETWQPGQLLLGDFEVQRVLGQGGMGKVYLVRSKTTGMEFAVKRALIKDDNNRQNFLSELQTWIDLPEHPHIAACRFFRTICDEIVIFAEYVGGGTLADWIRERRLTTLEQILDVAIQFAWGLQALHEHGLVHQDVKPGNVLMTPEGIAKVTDFGLARARSRSSDGQFHSPTPAPEGQSALVSFGGMTQAYCSPEQAAMQPLSRKTDIWSWGVSVLDMFYGGMSCHYGQTADESLRAYFKEGTIDEKLPRMPVEMSLVLGKCFLPKPEQRWNSMSEATDALIELYQKTCGEIYLRHITPTPGSGRNRVPSHDRRTRQGGPWTDPKEWLKRALLAEGRDPIESAETVAYQGSSRRGQLVADVAMYDEARCIFERLIKDGRKDLENHLAALCRDAAFLHETADDSPGALALYDQAIEIREHLVNVDGRCELSDALAGLYTNKANAFIGMGDNRAAVELYDRAIEIRERLVNLEGQRELANGLAVIYMNKAVAVSGLGNNQAAVGLYDRAIQIRERQVNAEGQNELANDLASLYMNKAIALMAMGDNRAAAALFDRAIEIDERLVHIEGRSELVDDLAKLYENKANAVNSLGDHQAAVALYDRAIEIRERLINVEGRRELTNGLASLYSNKAMVVSDMGDNRAAAILFGRAIEIDERLVNIEGRTELAGVLAQFYENKTIALMKLGDNRAAAALCGRAIEIRERLVNVEGRSELANGLASLYMNKAIAVSNLGDNQEAVPLYDRAIEILNRLVNIEGRSELVDDLARLYEDKANAVRHLGDNRAVVALYGLAIKILERLVNVEGRSELAGDLARLRVYRGFTLIELGDTRAGKREARNAMAVLREEVHRTGRADLRAVLRWITMHLGE